MTDFISLYHSKYTVLQKQEEKKEFTSEFTIKKNNEIISGKSRGKNQKFTSRLVSK